MNQSNRISANSDLTSALQLHSISLVWSWGVPIAVSLAFGVLSTPAQAATFSLGGFSFSEAAGDFTITGGEGILGGFRIFQDVTGPDIDLFMSISGLRGSGFIGFRFESILTNRTDTPWVFFDHELQEQLGTPSPEEDGLSFAQNIPEFRPFTSNAFSVVDEVTDVRDFVNFSGGVVNPNETVGFRYVVLDNAPNDVFFLRQRPNFAPGGVGLVAPDPIVPPPTEPVVDPPADPVVVDPPVVDPIPLPIDEPVATVPEPGIVLGFLSLFGMGSLLHSKHTNGEDR
ncbi:MAG: hypothetical protein AAF821_15030 [Cyanobacteria bacterium P01_D01_bin.156]